MFNCLFCVVYWETWSNVYFVLFTWRLRVGAKFILCCLFRDLEQCLFYVAYLEVWTLSNVYAPNL